MLPESIVASTVRELFKNSFKFVLESRPMHELAHAKVRYPVNNLHMAMFTDYGGD